MENMFLSASFYICPLTLTADFALSGLENSAHVLEQSGKMYSATLGLVDIVRGTNSYYKLQLLEDDVQKRSVVLQKIMSLLFFVVQRSFYPSNFTLLGALACFLQCSGDIFVSFLP